MNKRSKLRLDRQFRMTKQRRVILEELRKAGGHSTAYEVYEIVRRQLPHISLSTVYRNLEILSEGGMIQKLEPGGAQRRFDATKHRHYHVRCTRCGRMDDTPSQIDVDVQGTFQRGSDYRITGHRLELLGLCPQCQKEHEGLRGELGDCPDSDVDRT